MNATPYAAALSQPRDLTAPTRRARPSRTDGLHQTSRCSVPHEWRDGRYLGCAMRFAWEGSRHPCSNPRPAVERRARGAVVSGHGRRAGA